MAKRSLYCIPSKTSYFFIDVIGTFLANKIIGDIFAGPG